MQRTLYHPGLQSHQAFRPYQPINSNQVVSQTQPSKGQASRQKQGQYSNDSAIANMLKSETDFILTQITTYENLLNRYDRVLKFELEDQRLLMFEVFIMQIEMKPENMHWINWKSSDEVKEFLEEIQKDIHQMMEVEERKLITGKKIADIYYQISKKWYVMNANTNNALYGKMDRSLLQEFIQWLGLLGQHPYMRKTVPFLYFINHCLPLDKWNILVYQQLYIRKPFGVFDKLKDLFSDQQPKRKRDYFVTITGDGIIKSDNHLLQSRVDQMIPFTNLMKVKCLRKGDDITYKVTSGRTQSWQIKFHDDYVSAINFACGLGRARIDSYYKAPYKALTVTKKYTRQDYERQDEENTKPHRFSSFAPPRTNCAVKVYNDGCGYFEDLYECLMNAKYQICITDWMLTPYFLLRRKGSIMEDNIQNRLDGVLGQAAERGVKIFVILFMQPAMFVNNDSEGAAKRLEKMHKNIKVMRHPNVAVPIIWSHHEKLCVIDQKIGFMGGLDICYGRWDTPEHKLVEQLPRRQDRLWDGCEYNNYRTKDIYQPRKYQESNLNKDFQVRMPWHDIALQMRGDSVIDLLRHFVQYWYFVKSEYKMSPRKLLKNLQSRDPNIQKRDIGKHIKQTTEQLFEQRWQLLKEDITSEFFPGRQERVSQLLIEQRTGQNAGNTNIQMLRSANTWSIGADPENPERSIHQAYKDLIKKAQSHIYIENQFFMGLKNEIVKTLCQRIICAWKEKKPFKVIIVVPLLPGFEGDPGDPASTVLRIQVHYQKQAITGGQDSIYQTLKRNCPGIQISDYLFFFGLRKYDYLHGSPITQIIYVHSKLMIVDDKRAICGSANINDRSLWGSGDSQIAICIEQTPKSNQHLFDLRCRIYDEHFALTPQECKRITSNDVWKKLLARAKSNTLIYREVFGCIPDDQVTTHQEIQILASQANYKGEKLRGIVGHVVEYPLKFMDDQDLEFSLGQAEYFAPVESFT